MNSYDNIGAMVIIEHPRFRNNRNWKVGVVEDKAIDESTNEKIKVRLRPRASRLANLGCQKPRILEAQALRLPNIEGVKVSSE